MRNILDITMLGPAYPYRGGISHHTTLLACTLRKHHRLRHFSYTRQYPKWLFPGEDDQEPCGGTVRDSEVRYMLDSLNPWTWLRTARRISSEKVDVFLLPWWTVYWFPQVCFIVRYVRRYTSAKIIFLCHNVIEHESVRIKTWFSRTVLQSGDALLCHSDEENAVLIRYFPDKIIRKIYHPSYESLVENKIDKDEDGNALPHSPPKLLFFGFIRPYKGLEVLLRAMPEIHSRTGAVLDVVGEPWGDVAGIKALMAPHISRGLVACDLRYLPLDEVGNVFRSADLVVLPYHSATGCGVAQLAFGCGKPVVATDVGGLRDTIRNGENGFIFRPGDEKGLADAVVKSLSGSVYPVLVRGARRACHEFSWEGLADIIEDVAGQIGVSQMHRLG